VPLGCSTALVMNKRPGHAPHWPPAVAALAGMAIAISAVRPSATLTNLILRNWVTFIGICFSFRGATNLADGRRLPAVSLTCVGVRIGRDLTSSRRTHQSTVVAQPAAGGYPRQHKAGKEPSEYRSGFAGRQHGRGCGP